MSDYLSNLVNRSFTPARAIQPRGAVSYEGQALKNPSVEFVDPFAVTTVEREESTAETQAMPQVKTSPNIEAIEAAVEVDRKLIGASSDKSRDSTLHHDERAAVTDQAAADEVRPPL